MDRLREFSTVTLSLPDGFRVGEFEAYVIGVHGRVAALQPVARVDAMWLPETVESVLLSFADGAQTVSLKGKVRHARQSDDLRFRVTDGVFVPRRRSSRLKLCAPVTLVPDDGAEAFACQTHDVGADGLMVEGAGGLRRDQVLALSVMLPEIDEPVTARAVVTDVRNDLTTLEFLSGEQEARRRLVDFVTEHLRRRLNIVRSLRDDDDWD